MLRKALCSMCLVFVTLLPALAQDVPKAEVFGGYTWAGGNFHGWNASVTGNITKRFGIVADFSGHYGSELEGSILVKKDAHSFLFGPRFSFSWEETDPFCLCTVRGHAISGKRHHLRVKNYLNLTQGSARPWEAGWI